MEDRTIQRFQQAYRAAVLGRTRDVVKRRIGEIRAQAQMRGALHSSTTVLLILQLLEHELLERVSIAWKCLLRVLEVHRVEATEQLRVELMDLVRDTCRPDKETLTAQLDESCSWAPKHDRLQLDEAFEDALMRLGPEIDLFIDDRLHVAAQGGAPSAAPAHVYNFHGTVGSVQTGPNSTASVVQYVMPNQQELLAAVVALRDRLDGLTELDETLRRQVVETTESCRVELEKPTPNRVTLTRLLLGLATTIQTIPAVEPAYKALKVVASSAGIQLP